MFDNSTCPTSQILLQLPDVFSEVFKINLTSLEEILRLRHREHTLLCAGMLQQGITQKEYMREDVTDVFRESACNIV